MTWVRLDDQFADSPKLERAGPVAGWLHVAALCYCARHLTDGVIPREKAARLIPSAGRHIKALVREGVWHEPGHTCDRCPPCPDRHYVLHDYLDFQPSRAQVEADRAAARTRMARRRRKPDGTFDTRSPEQSPNTERSSPEVPGMFVHPVPSRPNDYLTSSSEEPDATPDPDDDDRQQPHDQDHHATVETAVAILAHRDLDQRQRADQLPPLGDPHSWLRIAIGRRRARHADQLTALATASPALTPDQLADAIDPAHTNGQHTARVPVPPPVEAVVADWNAIDPDPQRNVTQIADIRRNLRPGAGTP